MSTDRELDMQTIALAAQKGGTGKTTLALSLAVAAEAAGRRTLIVDLDPQASACKWGDRRSQDAPAIIDAQPSRLANALQRAAREGFEMAIIDTPARVEQAAVEASRAVDLVLIPCKTRTTGIIMAYSVDIRGQDQSPAFCG